MSGKTDYKKALKSTEGAFKKEITEKGDVMYAFVKGFRSAWYKKKIMLVVIDAQYGFRNEHTEETYKSLIDFLEKYHSKFDCIVGTKFMNDVKSACYRNGWKDCMTGSHDSEIVAEIEKHCDLVIDKNTYSAWDKLQKIVRSEHYTDVVFCGFDTGCCVLSTAVACFDAGVSCFVLSDLCGSSNGHHEEGLKVLEYNIIGNRVITSDKMMRLIKLMREREKNKCRV